EDWGLIPRWGVAALLNILLLPYQHWCHNISSYQDLLHMRTSTLCPVIFYYLHINFFIVYRLYRGMTIKTHLT
ncbi:hypothetical protein AMELA_G00077760, partial [Ameiurus melas]